MAQPSTINDPSDESGARVIDGALLVTGNISASDPSVGATGSPVPGNATFVGVKDPTGNLAGINLGNNTAVNSVSVVLATNQASVPVTPAANSTVQVTNTVNANITGGNVTATIPANATMNLTQVGGSAVFLGNNTAANSVPVVIATNQGAIPVTLTSTAITGNVSVVGPTAANVTVTGNPVEAGYRAVTAEAVPNGNNTVISPVTDAVGKTINQPYANKENMLRGNATVANTTAVNITGMGAQGAAFKIYLTSIQAFRTDAGTTLVYITLNDTGNTTVPIPPNGGAAINYPVPLALAANVTANVTLSANVTSVLVSAQGYFGT